MSNTTNLALPLMTGAQSQKHVTHNDALLVLDALVQAAVTSVTLAAPPGSPTEGVCYVVAASPTGAWSGKANNLAVFLSGAWRFIEPKTGWSIWNLATGSVLRWNGTSWVSAAEISDSLFALTNLSSPTKRATFNLSGLSTATTRDFSLPNVDGLLASLGNIAQTFTGDVTFLKTTAGYQAVATDAAFTINPADAAETRHTGTLTANRACTLGTSGAIVGQRKRLTRTG